MATSGSKKRSGDSARIRESKQSLGSQNDGITALKNQQNRIPSHMNASEMLSQYKNASIEFGSVVKPSVEAGRLSQQDEKDVNKGAFRLARELEQFMSKGLEAVLSEDSKSRYTLKSVESVADLQLQTARKLRQVRSMILYDKFLDILN
jgi:hypothetical protein